MSEGDAKQWLRYGLFGCLGCLGLVTVVIGLAVGTAWFRARSEKVAEEVVRQPAPEISPEPALPPSTSPTQTINSQPPSNVPGTVTLDLHEAEFHIEPGTAGDPIRIEARYDRNSYRLEEHSGRSENGGWTYSVSFRRTSSTTWWLDLIQKAFSSNDPTVRIYLPRGTPISLRAQLERGGLEAEFGGLDLTSASLNVSMGGLQLSVREPTAHPLERLEITTEMGGAGLKSIGNASPRVLEVAYRMGGMDCDLTGAWSADAEITLRGGMGGASVRLPLNVHVEGIPDRRFEGPKETETNLPTLRFDASSQLGDVKFSQ